MKTFDYELTSNKKIIIKSSGKYNLIIKKSKLNINLKVEKNIEASIVLINSIKIDININLDIKDNSIVNYYEAYFESSNINLISSIGKNSIFNSFTTFLGNNISSKLKFNLNKEFSKIYCNVISNLKENSIHNCICEVNHLSKNTSSELFGNIVLNENSVCNMEVNGYIKKDCKNSSVIQKTKILELSDKIKSNVKPNLIIDEYEVEASHAFTSSKISDEELYYLKSRGIDENESKRMIVYSHLLNNIKPDFPKEIETEIERAIL